MTTWLHFEHAKECGYWQDQYQSDCDCVPVKYLELSKGFVAKVDASDFDVWSAKKWTAVVTGQKIKRVYAYRRQMIEGKNAVIYLHREIMQAPVGMDVDHINGDTLDNTRANLRLATRSQNLANNRRAIGSVGFRGVSLNKERTKYRAIFRGKQIGEFESYIKAALAYDKLAEKEFGEFAKLNFPHELPDAGDGDVTDLTVTS